MKQIILNIEPNNLSDRIFDFLSSSDFCEVLAEALEDVELEIKVDNEKQILNIIDPSNVRTPRTRDTAIGNARRMHAFEGPALGFSSLAHTPTMSSELFERLLADQLLPVPSSLNATFEEESEENEDS